MPRDMIMSGMTPTSPRWAGDPLHPDYLVRGFNKIDPAAIAALGDGRKPVSSGTVVGRTLAERDAGTPYGLADAADVDVAIVAFDVDDVARVNDIELARPYSGLHVKENYLPGWGGLAAGVQALVRARYVCIRGAE